MDRSANNHAKRHWKARGQTKQLLIETRNPEWNCNPETLQMDERKCINLSLKVYLAF